jgi:RNA polymerase II elongation factor ELL
MSILNPKHRKTVLRHTQTLPAKPQAKPRHINENQKLKETIRMQNVAARPQTKEEKEQADIDALSARFQQAEADRVENSCVDRQLDYVERCADPASSTRILEGAVEVKGGKLKAGRGQLLSRPSALPRSQPGSPALSGNGSPSLGPTSNNAAQEKVKKLRFPLIHELAARDLTFGDLLPKWEGETNADFHTHLEKVADFKADSQKWSLVRNYYKDLDVFSYPYEHEEDRQRAIENAIKRYDQMRLPVSDPHWQKLLPVSERGKGICLSKVQAAIAKGPVAPAPKISVLSPKASSPSVDSEREDSGSSSTNKKAKVGSEPMARTNSGSKMKKTSEAQAQAKRLLSSKPPKAAAAAKPASKPPSAKTSPKVSPTKPVPKAAAGKGGRVLSKEFISDSDSDSSEEAPLSKTAAANKKVQELKDLKAGVSKASAPKASTPKLKPQPVERDTEKPRPAEKAREVLGLKTKPAPAKASPAPAPKILDSIRAEGAKPIRAPKRSRDDDDDSSSSGTPLSKRVKSQDYGGSKPQHSEPSIKHRKSDSSQNSRNSHSSGGSSSSAKPKTSPVKSSPLASSPPTNASEVAAAAKERDTIAVAKKRKFEYTQSSRPEKNHAGDRDRAGDRNRERYEKSSTSSDPYDKSDSSDSSLVKRAKHGINRGNGAGVGISETTREKAHRFKTFYVQYEALHRELSAQDDPPEDQVHELVEMHNRLRKLKREIESGI